MDAEAGTHPSRGGPSSAGPSTAGPSKAGQPSAGLGGLWWIALLVLLVASFALRAQREFYLSDGEGVFFADADTVRRLHRLGEQDAHPGVYPLVSAEDGAPAGSTLHWSLPMDWVLRALDPLLPARASGLGPYENGALWAGPVLGTLAVLAYAWSAARWIGRWSGLGAAAFFAFAQHLVEQTSAGNGDHQNLQELCLVLALLGLGAGADGRGGSHRGWFAGAALGLAIWVSTESMAFLALLAAGAFLTLWAVPGSGPESRRFHRRWMGACAAVLVVGHLVEHRSELLAFHWDAVSLFPLALVLLPLLALTAVPWFERRAGRHAPVLAGAATLAAALLAVLIVPPLRDAWSAELNALAQANDWTQAMVSEYEGLLFRRGVFSPGAALERLGWTILALPFVLFGCVLVERPGRSSRWFLLPAFVGAALLMVQEKKLVHFFLLLWPIVLVRGGTGWVRSFLRRTDPARRERLVVALGGGLCGAALLSQVLLGTQLKECLLPGEKGALADLRNLCTAVREAPGRETVLANWGLGAHLLYYSDKPVVASGYHRNLAGIRDAFRVLTAQDAERERLQRIFAERGVRWLVTQYPPNYFYGLEEVLPDAEPVVERVLGDGTVGYRPIGGLPTSLYWFLHTQAARIAEGSVPGHGFRPVRISTTAFEVASGGRALRHPSWILFEVLRDPR